MRISHSLVGFALIALCGCTVTEELPTRPDLIRAGGIHPSNGSPTSPSPAVSPTPPPSGGIPSGGTPPGGNPGTASPSPATSPFPPGIDPPPTGASPSPSPAASPSPSPLPSPLPNNIIDSIRVGFFGINCGRGRSVPRNGEKILPVGCRGYVTASPKDRNGDDVPAAIHGPDIDWFVLEGDDKIDVQNPTFASDFNKDVLAVRTGSFGLCATVREVTGCLMGTVVP